MFAGLLADNGASVIALIDFVHIVAFSAAVKLFGHKSESHDRLDVLKTAGRTADVIMSVQTRCVREAGLGPTYLGQTTKKKAWY